MNIDPVVLTVVYIVTTAISLLVLYVIVRFAVQGGVTSAMRRHEVWMRDGSMQTYLDGHAARVAEREEAERAHKEEWRRLRGE